MLRGTLIQFGVGYQISRVKYNATAVEARGFPADLVILSREPAEHELDELRTFKECMAHSTIRQLHIPEE